MELQFCHQCGTQVPSTAKFCSYCGTPVLKLTAEQPIPKPETVELVVEQVAPEVAPELETIVLPHEESVAAVLTLDALDSLPEEPSVEPQESQKEAPTPTIDKPVTPPVAPPVPPIRHVPVIPKKGILSRRGVGRTILAVLLCILIFVWSFASLSVLNLRLATTGEQGEKTFEIALSSIDLDEIPASMFIINLKDQDTSLADWLVKKISRSYTGTLDIDSDKLEEFLEESSVIPALSEKLEEYLTDIYTDSTDVEITAEEIEEVLMDNADLIEEIFGQRLSRRDIAKIAQKAEDSGSLKMLSSASLKKSNSQIYRTVQVSLSWWVIGILGVILLLMILLLQLVNRSILRTCRDTGITLMVVSGIWGLGGLFVMLLPKVWASLLQAIHPIDAVIGALLQGSLIPTAAAFGTGVVLVLIKVIGKAIVVMSAQKRTV